MRLRIVLVVLLVGIAPLAAWGWWILSSTRATGEALLRARMDAALDEIARGAGIRWIAVRSSIVDLSEGPAVRRAASNPGTAVRFDDVVGALGPFAGRADRVVVRDSTGRPVLDVRRPATAGSPSGLLPPLTMPVWGEGARRIGEVSVRLESTVLLPGEVASRPASGSVFAVLDASDRDGDVPLAMKGALLFQPRFVWGGEQWITARRELTEPGLVLAMASPLTPFLLPLKQAGSRAWVGLLAAGGLGVAVALLLSGPLVASLEGLADAADRVSAGSLDVRVEPAGAGEVARVARAFNHMTASLRETLDRAARQERLAAVGEFAASLAHEIRNPLTSIRLDLERASEGLERDRREARLVARALDEVVRLDGSVGSTLRLARSGRVEKRPVALVHAVRTAMERARPAFADGGVELVPLPDPEEAVWVPGDEASLERLVTNLLRNAVRACRSGDRVEVRVTPRHREVAVEVRDEGRGMSPAELARATEALYTTRPDGTGLGLALSRRVAAAHGGRLELESEAGEGTVARVVLPRSRTGPGSGDVRETGSVRNDSARADGHDP